MGIWANSNVFYSSWLTVFERLQIKMYNVLIYKCCLTLLYAMALSLLHFKTCERLLDHIESSTLLCIVYCFMKRD